MGGVGVLAGTLDRDPGVDAEGAAALTGPDTIDCIAPADDWQQFSSDAMAAKRRKAAWLHDTAEAAA